MARKLPRLERVLDAPALFSIAYGEVASSIYFALGVIALHALGWTPEVLLAAGLVFALVSLSYAEGTAAIRETGGAATFVRHAFNDLAGFVTGWVLFLDYLIVIALAGLAIPHYAGGAFGAPGLRSEPWDVVAGVAVILGVAAWRLVRRTRLYRFALVVALVDLATQLLLVLLGLALLFSPDALRRGTELGVEPEWGSIAFALPVAFLAYTGLETIASFAEETRSPGRTVPRSLFSAIGLVVAVDVAIAVVGLSAFPPREGTTELGDEWRRAPILGIVHELGSALPAPAGGVLVVLVGASALAVLVAAITTSMSGFGRLAYSLGEHGMLPRAFGRLHRRTLVAPQSIAAAGIVAAGILVAASALRPGDVVASLASLFSFGILLAFTAAQLAVVKLRLSQPDLRRPFRVPVGVRFRNVEVPLPSLVGLVATFAIWVVALATHPGARFAGPAWLAAGLVLFTAVRARSGESVFAHVESADERRLVEAARYRRILVPVKIGPIGEEMLATAAKLAQEGGARVRVLVVLAVALEQPLTAELPEEERRARDALADAREIAAEHGVEVEEAIVRARTIGEAIVEEAGRWGADVVVLGSAPRWRRRSRFFSPTVDHVLRRAPCEVVIVAFPAGVLEDEPSPA